VQIDDYEVTSLVYPSTLFYTVAELMGMSRAFGVRLEKLRY
jgi:hypothetical protein